MIGQPDGHLRLHNFNVFRIAPFLPEKYGSYDKIREVSAETLYFVLISTNFGALLLFWHGFHVFITPAMLTSAATFTEKESAFRAVDRAFDQMKQHDLSSVACSSPAISPAATPKKGGVHKASTKLIRELMEHSGIIDSLSEGGDSDSDAGSVLSDLHRSIGRLSSLRKQCIDGPISHATASQRIPVEGHNIRSMALVARDTFLPVCRLDVVCYA